MRAERPRLWILSFALLGSLAALLSRLLLYAARAIATPDRLRRAGLLVVVGCGPLAFTLAQPTPAWAQEDPSESLEIVLPDPGPTVREIVSYDGGDRRDPFTPLYREADGGIVGPRLEMLKLTGIFEGAGTNSLIVLEDGSRRGYFVRIGQQVGDARLVDILPDAAVFERKDYGSSRRVILRLDREPVRRP